MEISLFEFSIWNALKESMNQYIKNEIKNY